MLLVVVVEWKAWKARWLRPMACLLARSKPLLAPVFLELRKFEVVGVVVLIVEGWASIHACHVTLWVNLRNGIEKKVIELNFW